MNDPEDYAGGMSEMIADDSNTPYRALAPLSQRKTTEIKLRAPGGVSEAEMAAKFGFSQPIAMMFKMTQKMYGYMKDGNIQTDVEHAALDGANRLNDIVLDAPCLNREGRYAYEEARAQDWLKSVKKLEEVDDAARRVVGGQRIHAPGPDRRRPGGL